MPNPKSDRTQNWACYAIVGIKDRAFAELCIIIHLFGETAAVSPAADPPRGGLLRKHPAGAQDESLPADRVPRLRSNAGASSAGSASKGTERFDRSERTRPHWRAISRFFDLAAAVFAGLYSRLPAKPERDCVPGHAAPNAGCTRRMIEMHGAQRRDTESRYGRRKENGKRS